MWTRRRPTTIDAQFSTGFSQFSTVPLTVTLREDYPWSEVQGLVNTTNRVDWVAHKSLWVRATLNPVLSQAPAGTVDYLAAGYGISFGENPYPYPNRREMARIRPLLAAAGDYPFHGSAGQSYHQVTWDRNVRMLSPHRLTDEMATWLDAHDVITVFPSWRARLMVQNADAEIWGA